MRYRNLENDITEIAKNNIKTDNFKKLEKRIKEFVFIINNVNYFGFQGLQVTDEGKEVLGNTIIRLTNEIGTCYNLTISKDGESLSLDGQHRYFHLKLDGSNTDRRKKINFSFEWSGNDIIDIIGKIDDDSDKFAYKISYFNETFQKKGFIPDYQENWVFADDYNAKVINPKHINFALIRAKEILDSMKNAPFHKPYYI